MGKLSSMINEIAYNKTPAHNLSHLSLIPLLYICSSFYEFALIVRHALYDFGFIRKHRLPVLVISVGNLTWGGNGKILMVEFIASWFAKDVGVSPLILTRGYGGADEARMLQRHFNGTSVEIGVGVNRAATAASFLHKHSFIYPLDISCLEKPITQRVVSNKIRVAILDDGMQVKN